MAPWVDWIDAGALGRDGDRVETKQKPPARNFPPSSLKHLEWEENMSKMKKRIVVMVSGLALLGGAITAATTIAPEPALAAGCYDSAKSFYKRPSGYEIPTGSGWWKTTSNCNDINIRLADNSTHDARTVKVCFERTGCQGSWTTVRKDRWTVVASNVKDGTTYRLKYSTYKGSPGLRAD